MIFYHEGLPGAGKTYEAVAYHILPAIQNMRPVITNIEGINHELISEMTHVPLEWIKANLICVFDSDYDVMKQNFVDQSVNGALVVIDEVDKIWTAGRYMLPDDQKRFITEHRHDGLTIILMGQDRSDCHNFWAKRIQRVIYFRKMDAVGLSGRYRWESQEVQSKGRWKKINSGTRSYKAKYFPLYQSHTTSTGEDEQNDIYKDKRSNVFINSKFLFYVPVFFFVLYWLITNFLIPFFDGSGGFNGNSEVKKTIVTPVPISEPIKTPVINSQNLEPTPLVVWVKRPDGQIVPKIFPAGTDPSTLNFPMVPNPNDPKLSGASLSSNSTITQIPTPEPVVYLDVFDEFAANNRLRLSGVIHNFENPENFYANVQIIEAISFRQKDSFSTKELRALGWTLKLEEFGLLIEREDKSYLARQFTLEPFGRVSRHTGSRM